MLWPSTVIGAGAGFAIASIPGALLGALLGQAMDRRMQLHSWAHVRERLGGRPVLRDDEVLFVLLGRLAKSDGRVGEGHIQQARQEMYRLEMGEPERRRAIAAFNRGKNGKDRLGNYLLRLKQQPHAAEGMLRACWRMAWADGRAGRHERELLLDWGQKLGWSAAKSRRWPWSMNLSGMACPMRASAISKPCACWAWSNMRSLRRSNRHIAGCSAATTRTNWWVAAQARPKCVKPQIAHVICIRRTRSSASVVVFSRLFPGLASLGSDGTVALAPPCYYQVWRSTRPGDSCCP